MKIHWKTFIFVVMGTALCGLLISGCKKDKPDNNNKSPSYFEYGGHSYQIVKEKKPWMDAASDAAKQGGYLAEIGSKAEQDAIYEAIQKSGISTTYTQVADGGGIAYIWIGATDRLKEGEWIWNGAWQSGEISPFWRGGSPVGGRYVNWGGTSAGNLNEPDNFTHPTFSPNGQNAAAMGLAKWPDEIDFELGKAGEWNDIAESNTIYYVVEFDTIK